MFRSGNVTSDTLAAAQSLIDELPLESPLRFRFGRELQEIRQLVTGQEAPKRSQDRGVRKRSKSKSGK